MTTDLLQAPPAGRAASRPALASLAILTLVGCCNNMDRMLMAAVAHPVKLEFGLSDTQLGLLTGLAFALFYSGCGIPLGRLADRVSRKKLIVACLLGWSAVTALTGLAQNYAQLFVARMGVGLGEAGCTPSAQSLLCDSFPPRRRNLAIGIFFFGTTLGTIVGFAVGGWIAQAYGWRRAFLVLGLPGLLLALLVGLWLEEAPRGREDAGRMAERPALRDAIALLSGTPSFVLLVLGTSLNGFGSLGLAQWMPLFFIRSHGLSLAAAGLVFGVAAGLGMGFGQLIGGVMADRLAHRSLARSLWVSVGASLMLVPCALTALWLPSSTAAAAAVVVMSLVGAIVAPAACTAALNSVPAGVRATAVAVVGASVAILGTGLGPVVIGLISDLLTPTLGAEALRAALAWAQLANIGAAGLYFLAMRAVAARG